MTRARHATNAALTSSADADGVARDDDDDDGVIIVVDSRRSTHSRSRVPFLVSRLKQCTSLDDPAVWTLRNAVVSLPNSMPSTSCSSTVRKFPSFPSGMDDGDKGEGLPPVTAAAAAAVPSRWRFNSARHVRRFRYSDGGGCG